MLDRCSGVSGQESLAWPIGDSIFWNFIPSLLQHVPQVPGAERTFPASVEFSVVVLEHIGIENGPRYPKKNFLPQLIDPLMRRVSRKKPSFDYV